MDSSVLILLMADNLFMGSLSKIIKNNLSSTTYVMSGVKVNFIIASICRFSRAQWNRSVVG